MNRIVQKTLILAAMIVVSGCATSRGVLDVSQEVAENPVTGEAVKFVRRMA